MSRKALWIAGLLAVALFLAPVAGAQVASPEEVVKDYFSRIERAAESGDLAPLLELFTEGATFEVPATQAKASGKDEIAALHKQLFEGYLKGVRGEVVGQLEVVGGQVVATYKLTSETVKEPIAVKCTFAITEGKIQSLLIDLPPGLPRTGGAGNALPQAIVLGGLLSMILGSSLLLARRRPKT